MNKPRSNAGYRSILQIYFVLIFSFFISSCKHQDNLYDPDAVKPDSTIVSASANQYQNLDSFKDLNIDRQIMLVLRRIFQDKSGNIWFVGDGVFCYNGKSMINLSDHEVFKKATIRQIAEDKYGNIWFGTSEGIIKYDSSKAPDTSTPLLLANESGFTKFTKKDGLADNDVWSMMIDDNSIIWVGTLGGVSQFNGTKFTTFNIPETKPDPTRGVTSSKIVHSIMQDGKKNIWFGTNGGAYVYDTTKDELFNISEKDGLCNNIVNDILEDKKGNIWFATHHGGVCRWDGTSFTHVTTKLEIQGTESWSLYEDRSGNIWFPIEHAGIYSYNYTTGTLKNFNKKDGLMLRAVHSVIQDTNGVFWLGGFGGLYRDDSSVLTEVNQKPFVNITKDHSWK